MKKVMKIMSVLSLITILYMPLAHAQRDHNPTTTTLTDIVNVAPFGWGMPGNISFASTIATWYASVLAAVALWESNQ